ncbi:non-ribosomal peptide synthetase [Amycolatopsis samaneae]|uniref:Non-ribosomal peptide synthetase n=1 Tax=Amycolatopsis samaneae TaxID=664691 RepID=A0ABW5GX49_9PSEU
MTRTGIEPLPGRTPPTDPRAALATLFAHQVTAGPERIAVRQNGYGVSYARLDRWSDGIAGLLTAHGVGTGDLVALAAAQGPSTVAAVLALIKIGAGYVALGPDVPAHRQRLIVAQNGPVAVLAQRALDPGAEVTAAPRVWLDDEPEPAAPQPRTPRDTDLDTLVFQVVHTSGTTGTPKGVRIGYGAVLNRLRWMWNAHPFPDGSVVGLHKPPGLVASAWEMLGGLLRGIPTEAFTHEEVRDPELSVDRVLTAGVTHLFLTPPLVDGLLSELDRRGRCTHRLRLVTSGADMLPAQVAHRFHTLLPDTKLLNLYGMSETASNVAAFDTVALSPDAVTVPVGSPVAGAVIEIRDRHHRPLPPGMRGEIWVSGPPLALGYAGDEQLTAERFVADREGTVWYRTGDVGRWLPGGALEIVGRADNQVKIRGYRVELEEIEAVLRTVPGVTGAGVFAESRGDAQELVACVTAPESVDSATVREHLRGQLPDYMVPGHVLRVPAIPLSGNGKLDRRALAVAASAAAAAEAAHDTYRPTDEVEAAIVSIWTELLGRPPADDQQRFHDAGGHSLLAVQLANQLEKTFHQHFALRDVLAAQCVQAIAALVRQD